MAKSRPGKSKKRKRLQDEFKLLEDLATEGFYIVHHKGERRGDVNPGGSVVNLPTVKKSSQQWYFNLTYVRDYEARSRITRLANQVTKDPNTDFFEIADEVFSGLNPQKFWQGDEKTVKELHTRLTKIGGCSLDPPNPVR